MKGLIAAALYTLCLLTPVSMVADQLLTYYSSYCQQNAPPGGATLYVTFKNGTCRQPAQAASPAAVCVTSEELSETLCDDPCPCCTIDITPEPTVYANNQCTGLTSPPFIVVSRCY